MEQQNQTNSLGIARLVPLESFGPDVRALSPYALADDDVDHGDVICSGLEELSRHLKWLDDDYQSCQFERLEARARSIVMLADQLGLRRVGQVAADVVYCLDGPDEVALASTLSRLMRLITQVLDHAAGPMTAF
jgi:hypothetical protein